MAWYANTFEHFLLTPVRPAPPARVEQQLRERARSSADRTAPETRRAS